ncbi:helix-turn-helix domain-containing protein [Nocardioides speluncae]|uniref:helix-turn-helix domain-containing protein n=1 Tax=Nocardioides speluncae TaxID=2670337 RepID=UPI0012B1852C|nr:helix-turn-helix transcriptional regulator [Nocardioides speluncae]
MRNALAAWHIGRAIAAYRLHPWHGEPLPQHVVAAWMGTSQARLSRIENGPPIQDLGKLIELARLFDIPAGLLWFRLPGQSDVVQEVAPTGDDLQGLADLAARQSLGFAARARDLPHDDAGTDYLRWELSRLAVGYVHAPLSSLLRGLVGARDNIFQLLETQRRPDEMRDLYFLAGTSCLLLAHASQNIGHHGAALSQLRSAWTCADVAGHDALKAWSRGTAALFHEWSTARGSAIGLATAGQRFASSRESRIRLAAIEARAAARVGQRDQARKSIATLQALRETDADADDVTELGGILSFPEAKQQYYLGSTYGLLGDHHLAEQYALSAAASYETGPEAERSYGDEALARMDVVNARIAAGDVDGAVSASAPVLALPADRRIEQLDVATSRTQRLLASRPMSRSSTGRELGAALTEFQLSGLRPQLPSVR